MSASPGVSYAERYSVHKTINVFYLKNIPSSSETTTNAATLSGAASYSIAIVGGLNGLQAHEILGPFVEPISAAILILVAGVLAGGIGFLIIYRTKNAGILQEPLSS